MRTRRCGFLVHLERDEFLLHAVSFLFGENRAAIESTFVERNKKSDARFNRRGVLIQFVAVKRIANFRAQRVARAEAAWLDSELFSDFQKFFPRLLNCYIRAGDFKSIFTRVAGSRNQNASAREKKSANFIFLQVGYTAHAHGRN